MPAARVVIDSSAIIAFLKREPGGDVAGQHISGALVSAVNVAEVASKLAEEGMPEAEIRLTVADLGMEIVPFSADHALQVGALRRLGESDHVPDRRFPGQQHDQPVDAQRDAAVRRSAMLQRVQEEPETVAGVFLAEAQCRKHPRLHVLAMNTNRARAELDPVQHQVVGA